MRKLFILFLLGVSVAHADWKQLKVGMDAETALKLVGQPLMIQKARGIEIWIYDSAGELEFVGGRLNYWQAPQTNSNPSAQTKI